MGPTSPPGPTPGSFNFLIGNKLTSHVIISALNRYTTTKILANPSLVVLDNQRRGPSSRPAGAGHNGQGREYVETATAASVTVLQFHTYRIPALF